MGAPIREELVLADSFSQTFRNFDAAANAAINVAEEFQKNSCKPEKRIAVI